MSVGHDRLLLQIYADLFSATFFDDSTGFYAFLQ